MNAACNLGMNSKYGIIMKLIAEEVSMRSNSNSTSINYAKQFSEFPFTLWGVRGDKADPVFTV